MNPIDPTIRGEQPSTFQAYPARLYRVTNRKPLTFDGETVGSEVEQRNLESRGFVAGGQGEALKAYDAEQRSIAKLAANRAHGEQRMSPEAQAEAQQYEADADGHVPVIPEQPKKPRGRPVKLKT